MNDPALPAWAREEAFSIKPDNAPYGCVDHKKKSHGFGSLEELQKFLASGKSHLGWVWVPDHERLIAPEELEEFEKPLLKRRALLAHDEISYAKRNLWVFGGVLVWVLYATVSNGGDLFSSQVVGLSAILFLVLGVKPWWESRANLASVAKHQKGDLLQEVPEARFDLWLGLQRVWLVPVLIGLVIAVFAVQYFDPKAIEEAGIQKDRYRAGERWLILTGAFLHGGLLHLGMNASALWYLGRRTEILARWPHLAAVFFVSIIGAGWATVTFMPHTPSVGVSGAVSGLLGFLLVFETLHRPLVPRSARVNLLGMLVLMVIIGGLGFQMIDNAAHVGGLITGALYAVIVFPKSSSTKRPGILKQDKFVGGVTLVFSVLSALLAIALIALNK